MTQTFLGSVCREANDLITPRPEMAFSGLKPGVRWCLSLHRWLEALEAGVAPPVVLECTHALVLDVVALEVLQAYALTGPKVAFEVCQNHFDGHCAQDQPHQFFERSNPPNHPAIDAVCGKPAKRQRKQPAADKALPIANSCSGWRDASSSTVAMAEGLANSGMAMGRSGSSRAGAVPALLKQALPQCQMMRREMSSRIRRRPPPSDRSDRAHQAQKLLPPA